MSLQAFRRDTIGRMPNRIVSGQVKLQDFDFVIFHVGTNDIGNKALFEAMLSDYGLTCIL